MGLYARALRPVLFRLDPERTHELAVRGAALSGPMLARLGGPPDGDGRLTQTLMGLTFPNPIGLAAGYDKRALGIAAWPAIGFGFSEIGTVTALAQPGNPRPRLFRLGEDRALINRMGFNNDGSLRVARRLAGARRRRLAARAPLGVNLGKSKLTPAADAPRDYATSLERLWEHADYVVVNVSSPNTPGLRDLQAIGPLGRIIDALEAVNRRRAEAAGLPPRPLLVKIAPDLADPDVDAVVDLAIDRGLAGVIVANTTLSRAGLTCDPALAAQAGGLSGAPLRGRCTALVGRVAERAAGALVVIGVGGIFSADDVWDTLAAGADLVQIFTGFVYGGPLSIRRLNAELLARMDRAGVDHIRDLSRPG
ncbi:MAG TPA: quinone-dependent dihydroorotate dehydrogenase [Miltoncostaeaceae bacterium]|nr:quinone-dependent dihydroorotate dehydrogenase [Miltoncostaeaceae bacterium]